jgi:hypothetical protein
MEIKGSCSCFWKLKVCDLYFVTCLFSYISINENVSWFLEVDLYSVIYGDERDM